MSFQAASASRTGNNVVKLTPAPRLFVRSRKVPCSGQRLVSAQSTAFPNWDMMWTYLTDKQVTSVQPGDAQKMVARGDWVMVDVRPKELYEQSTVEGAISVPLFQSMDFSKATPQSLLKAAAYAFNGVKPVELNPSFVEDMRSQIQGKKAIVFCEAGGTLRPSANFMRGKTSRSLKAAWVILQNDIAPAVAHLEGGIFLWYKEDLPMTGEYDTSNVGRTPNAAVEPKIEEAMKK